MHEILEHSGCLMKLRPHNDVGAAADILCLRDAAATCQ
jgi:hypothetical protein